MIQPYYDDGTCTIYHGDSRDLLADLRGDVVVTDPPYGLAFMGKAWDRVDQPFHKEWANSAFRALPPGGWLLAFGGTRTWHRLACGIEDAGFEIRDTLMWLYGSGFPKGKACLKPGWEPILLARKPGSSVLQIDACRVGIDPHEGGNLRRAGQEFPSNADARSNNVYGQSHSERGGYYSPSGRWPANVVLVHSESCRPVGVRKVRGITGGTGNHDGSVYGARSNGGTPVRDYADPDGTETVEAWECDEDSCPVFLLDQQSGNVRSSGHVNRSEGENQGIIGPTGLRRSVAVPGVNTYADKGGASRFFATFPHDDHDSSTMGACLLPGDASTRDASTSAGKRAVSSTDSSPTDGSGSRPTAPSLPGMTSTTGTTTPSTTTSPTSSVSPEPSTSTTTDGPARITPSSARSSTDGASGATLTDPLTSSPSERPGPIRVTARTAPAMPSGNGEPPSASTTTPTCGHTECALAASPRFFYTAKAGRNERVTVDGEQHPTVKPLALMRWLVRLVTPPGGTVLDPFCGSGSTLVAARMEGFRAIGVEADERWCRGSAQRGAQVPPLQETLAI